MMGRSKKFYSPRRAGLFNISMTNKIVAANIIAFFIFLVIISLNSSLADYIFLKPSLILKAKSLWTIITSMFMHAGLLHLFVNMFSLFFIGNFLEKIIGRKRFFWLYILSGILGGIFFVLSALIFQNTEISGVGASGALFGLLGVLAVLVPNSKIYLIAGPLIVIVIQAVAQALVPSSLASTVLGPINIIANILIIIMIFAIFSFNLRIRKISVPLELPMWLLPIVAIVPLSVIALFIDLPIGNSAHVGGLVAGLLYGFYLRYKYKRKVKLLNRYFR